MSLPRTGLCPELARQGGVIPTFGEKRDTGRSRECSQKCSDTLLCFRFYLCKEEPGDGETNDASPRVSRARDKNLMLIKAESEWSSISRVQITISDIFVHDPRLAIAAASNERLVGMSSLLCALRWIARVYNHRR